METAKAELVASDENMITYEANLVCDVCENQCVTGMPMDTPEQAREQAVLVAIRKDWCAYDGQIVCCDCMQKRVHNRPCENCGKPAILAQCACGHSYCIACTPLDVHKCTNSK